MPLDHPFWEGCRPGQVAIVAPPPPPGMPPCFDPAFRSSCSSPPAPRPPVRCTASCRTTSTATPTPAPTSSTTPTARGASRTRSPTTWTAGAGAGSPARSTRNTCATSSPRCRRSTTGRRAAPSSCRATSTPPAWTKARSTSAASRRCSRCSTKSARSRRAPTCSTRSPPARRRHRGAVRACTRRRTCTTRRGSSRNVDAGGLGLPDRDYYLKPEQRFVEARAKYLEHVAKMFDARRRQARRGQGRPPTPCSRSRSAWPRPRSTTSRCATRSSRTTRRPSPQLQKLAPAFDWAAYFDAAKLPHADLNVAQPKFLQQVDKELATTPRRPVAHLPALAACCNAAADALSEPFVEENFAFYGKYLSGATEMKPRWKRCAEDTDDLLGEALGRAYVEKYFPPEAKARMQDMVKNILLAMHDTIEGLDWMSAGDQGQGAGEAVHLQSARSAIPTSGRPTTACASRAPRTGTTAMAASRWNVADDRAQIGKPVDRGRWGMTPPTSNAYYNPLLNEIVFPAGILQPPAFDVNATDAVNYGAIGVVDRPRDQPRLRRPGRAVRRAGTPGQLVDAGGQQQVHRARASAS